MNSKNPDLIKLKKHIGLRAYAALRRGAKLHVWRRSSPHNWWIENKKGEMLWHSDGWGDHPNLNIFLIESHSNEKIEYHPIHNDGFKPESSTYILKFELQVNKCAK